jgi:hypothetical protein
MSIFPDRMPSIFRFDMDRCVKTGRLYRCFDAAHQAAFTTSQTLRVLAGALAAI